MRRSWCAVYAGRVALSESAGGVVMLDKRCSKCEHRRKCNDFEPKTICNYILDTGHRRPPLVDGRCQVFIPKTRRARGVPGRDF